MNALPGVFLAVALVVVLEARGLDVSRMFVRAWVWLYTLPVPRAARERRRDELAEHLATERGDRLDQDLPPGRPETPMGRGVRTLLRLGKGIWSDLAWATQRAIIRDGRDRSGS